MNTKSDYAKIIDSWMSRYIREKSTYGNLVWENIGNHPQDILLSELGKMFVDANQEQRNEIKEIFRRKHKLTWQSFLKGRPVPTWQSVLFIRRVAKMLESKDQVYLLQIGLAIADIVAGLEDFRDILSSLAILKYGAERVGIDMTSLIEKSIPDYSVELTKFLKNVQSWSKRDIDFSVKKFGPADWAQELL